MRSHTTKCASRPAPVMMRSKSKAARRVRSNPRKIIRCVSAAAPPTPMFECKRADLGLMGCSAFNQIPQPPLSFTQLDAPMETARATRPPPLGTASCHSVGLAYMPYRSRRVRSSRSPHLHPIPPPPAHLRPMLGFGVLSVARAENKVFSEYARFWASLRGPDPSEAIAESAAKRLAQRFVSGVGSRRMY